jgi:hypothetical protein
MPLVLSETQFLAICNAAAALNSADRDSFICAVAAELVGREIGDGSVACAIRTVAPKFAHPEPPPVPGRWQRERPRFERTSKAAG